MLERIWRQQPGDYFCIATRSSTRKWVEHFFARSELANVRSFIAKQRGHDVYFAPNAFSKASREAKYAIRGSFLYADLDDVDIYKLEPEPTIAVKTSSGHYQAL